jgi:hypothetical protein
MIDILREILLNFQETELPSSVPRRLHIPAVSGKAGVCIGVRRCGKSTLMFQLMKNFLATGVSRQNILYLNFFDDRLHALKHEGLGVILEAYFSIYPEKKNTETIYCFFDEIQVVPGWEPFVDRLMRTEKCEVYLTGSSAQMLAKEIATQMRGRALPWELFPFSFREFLDYKGIDGSGPLSTKKRLTIQNAFEDYWETGGFPETLGFDRYLRIKVHQEYWGAMLFRDLVERHDIAHPKAVTDLAHWLVDNSGSLYSINNLTGYLKSLGHKVPKTAVADYLEWFQDAYIMFTLRIYDASIARANTNPKKIYCIDHALVRSISSGILVNSGHLLENLVFVALRRVTPAIFYYKTRTGREVDFIIQGQDRSFVLVQVCESLADPRTRKRETTALAEAMEEMQLGQATIVTRIDEARLTVESGIINVVPVWRFLLDIDTVKPGD